MRLWRLIPVVGAFILAACGRDPVERLRENPEVLAVVGRYFVSRGDFEAVVKQNQAARTQDALVRSRLLDQLVRDLLVLNDSVEPPSGALQPLGEYADPAARAIKVDDVLQQRIYGKVSVSEEAVRRYYREHPALYRKGPGVLLREMQIPDEKRAREAYRQIMKGRPFIEVARQYGTPLDQGARYFQNDELPEYLQPVLSKMGPGAVTEPIAASSEFYQIIIVVKRYEEYVTPLNEAREEIRLQLSDQKGEEMLAQYLEQLRGRYRVTVFWTKLPFTYGKEKP
jgi:parvulin-like peptidyl-prolyl isomerase